MNPEPVLVRLVKDNEDHADLVKHTRAHTLHANSYLVKPVSFDHFPSLMKDMTRYWNGWNTTPLRTPSSRGAAP